MVHYPQASHQPRDLTTPNKKVYIQESTMTSVPNNDQAPAFDPLQAISGDNGNFDPRYAYIVSCLWIYIKHLNRTYQVHQTTMGNILDDLIFVNPLYTSPIHRPRYYRARLQDPRVENWVRTNQYISDTTGFESPEENWEETSCCNSVDTLIEGQQIPISLETEPPFPTQNQQSSLFAQDNHIWHQSATTLFNSSEGQSSTDFAAKEEGSDSSCENALLPFCRPPPAHSTPTSSGASDPQSCETQWLIPLAGHIITTKAREACRKLRRKLSREKNLDLEDGH